MSFEDYSEEERNDPDFEWCHLCNENRAVTSDGVCMVCEEKHPINKKVVESKRDMNKQPNLWNTDYVLERSKLRTTVMRIPTAFLTGSKAMGLGTKESDYDVCVYIQHLTDDLKSFLDEQGFTRKDPVIMEACSRYYHERLRLDLFFVPYADYIEIFHATAAMKNLRKEADRILLHTLKDRESRWRIFEQFREVYKIDRDDLT